jgi:hypothetical protein
MTILDARETELMIRKVREDHPNYDGIGCDNHVVCTEYEDVRLLRMAFHGENLK